MVSTLAGNVGDLGSIPVGGLVGAVGVLVRWRWDPGLLLGWVYGMMGIMGL